jgi:hypothetical protein
VPFWYDEQWRGYHLSLTTAFWRELQHINTAVAAGWVAVERASVFAFGNVEWAWRLPQVLALPALAWATWRVARHWLGMVASAVIAAAVLASGPVVLLATELKPFTTEALCCVAGLLLWLEASDPHRHPTLLRTALYVGIGLCAVVATPLVFVIAPLLAVDIARGLWHRDELLQRAGPAMLAGGLALAHLAWFILPQLGNANVHYWDANFLPGRGQLGFVASQLGTFVPEVVSYHRPLPPGVNHAVTALLVVGLASGTAFAVTDRLAWPLPVALAGALTIQLVASALHLWPFGFVRVNVFLVPLFYLLAGFGVARLAGFVQTLARHGRPATRTMGVAALAVVLTGAAVGCWGVARASAAAIAPAHRQQLGSAWGDGMRALVGQARDQAGPRDLSIVAGRMGVKGWSYYMWHYEGWSSETSRASGPIPPDRTLMGDPPDRPSVTAFLAAHPTASRVLVLTMTNAKRGWKAAITRPLRAAGYQQVRTSRAPQTGMLALWETRSGMASAKQQRPGVTHSYDAEETIRKGVPRRRRHHHSPASPRTVTELRTRPAWRARSW